MDRRNGGDPLAPPRPPKSLPRVHRPRAPEPAIMSSAADTTSTANRSLSNVPPQLSPKPRNLSSSSSSTTTTTTPAAPRSSSNISSSIPPPLPPQIVPLTPLHTRSQHHHHQQHLLPSSHNNSSSHSLVQPASTFSRRRPPAALPSLSVAVSSSNSNILGPPSLETSLPPAATSPVTLAAPRPENERLTNEYVDTPFSNSRLSPPSSNRVPRSAATPGSAVAAPQGEDPTSRQLSSVSPHSPSSNSSSTTGKPIGSTAMPTTLHGSGRNFNNNTINTRPNQLPLGQQHRTVGAAAVAAATPLSAGGSPTIQSATLPITKQPVSNHTFSKDAAATATGLHELDCIELHPSTNGDLLNSITCPHCKKCRCEECQRSRQLPSRWLCDNSCLCSAETIIDYASCLCVVKALYYHCSKDHEMERESDTISCAEDPCSCLPHKRTTRWGLLGALSLGLPCLWCYWPMRGCVAVCAKCYAKHSRHGCRCQLQNGAGSLAGSILGGGGPGQSANGTTGPDHAKFSAVTGTSPVFGIKAKHHHHSSHHHHHHHHSDLTPEKRLLDSSPEY
ncbi:protein sprouty [Culex quinquefasciatus]|uniref:protein sprouty n=1 Tax=Culex quinquefasciatus TaxID=7176 RepID=UPI0018E35315|nr:protein sprouty [Culex quinquefasciatus]